MKTKRILVFCPRGAEQQKYWEDWAFVLREQGESLDLILECYDRREEWVKALTLRETETDLLGAACTLQDLEKHGEEGDIAWLDGLVQRGLPVLACSRRTLEEEPLDLRKLCQRQWQLLLQDYKERL